MADDLLISLTPEQLSILRQMIADHQNGAGRPRPPHRKKGLSWRTPSGRMALVSDDGLTARDGVTPGVGLAIEYARDDTGDLVNLNRPVFTIYNHLTASVDGGALVLFHQDGQGDYWTGVKSDEACPDGAKNSLCLETANGTVKVDVKNGELCVREIPETAEGEDPPEDNCDDSYVFDACDCDPRGGLADCPCYEGDIDTAESGGGDTLDAYDSPDYLPTHPENDPALITTEGQVFYRFDSTEHWWLWKQEIDGRIEFFAAYWEEGENAVIKRINCENETVAEVETYMTLDGGTA